MKTREPSPAQQRFWLLQQLDGVDATGETLPVAVRFDGTLDLDRLLLALRTVFDRHEVLRSCYRWERDRLVVGDLLPADAIELLEVGSRVAPTWDEAAVVAFVQDLADRQFDLVRGPLVRGALLADGPERTYLCLAVHHMVWDGWSFGVLLDELSAAYETSAELPPLPVQYWDYSDRARASVGEARGERDLAYWTEQLDGLDGLAPLARDAAGGDPLQIHRVQVALDGGLVERVAAFAQEHNVTPFNAFAASLQAVLYRMGLGGRSGLGVPLADRTARDFELLIGCFLNTIVLRGSVDGEETFAELVTRVRDTSFAALQHRGIPFETVVKRLAPRRDLLASPLFQAVLAFQNYPPPTRALGGAEASAVRVPRRRGRIEPTFTVWLRPPDPVLVVEWNGSLAIPAERLAACWLALLEAGMRDPQATIDVLPLAIAVPGNAGEAGLGDRAGRPGSQAATVSELLRAQAARTPDAVAAIDESGELTLAQVVTRADAVAERLRQAGVGPGAVVGLAAGRSTATLVAALGVLEAGAVCLPLDPGHPDERLRLILERARPALVLCGSPPRGALGEWSARALDGGGTARALASPGVDDGVAWILLTSGSTGVPKGVLLGHEMIVARLACEPIPWTPGERCCHKTPLTFVDALWELFGPLAHGLATVVASEEEARDPRMLARALERHRVTRIVLVPSLLAALLDLPAEDRARLAGVRTWSATGEPLPGALAERFHAALPEATLVNLYGTSECWDVSWQVVPRSVRAGDRVGVGRPLAGVRVWLLDDGLNAVPPGVPGELFVGGRCVSRGYLDDPELTAARFVPAGPLDGRETGVAYRTGDVARQREDGSLEVLGRRDLQVKLRGFRIELEEVERHLRAAPGVRDAGVAAVRDDDGVVDGLVAQVVPHAGEHVDVAALRQALGGRLPAHCVPSAIRCVERLPLLPSGKLDRAALAQSDRPEREPEPAAAAPPMEPRTDEERALAAIWCEVLDLDRVGVTESFFDLGGHSLLAVQVMIRVEEQLAIEIPLRELYERPTIAELGELLAR